MASTNKTTNLELSQFIGSDSPKWLTDYNADMQKIDAAVGSVQSQADATDLVVSGHTAAIESLQATTGEQGTSITGLRTDVNHNAGDISTINSLIGNGEPTTTDKTIIGAINELHADETALKTRIDASHVFKSIQRVSVSLDATETIAQQLDRLKTRINTFLSEMDSNSYAIPVAFGFGNGYEGTCKLSNSMVLTHNSTINSSFIDASISIVSTNLMIIEGRIGSTNRLNRVTITTTDSSFKNEDSDTPTSAPYVDFMIFGKP